MGAVLAFPDDVVFGNEFIDVRCESGALITRVRRRPGTLPDDRAPSTEHMCKRCRRLLSRLVEGELLVLHYVNPSSARVVETRAIRGPIAGSRALNRGGRLVSREVFLRAIENSPRE